MLTLKQLGAQLSDAEQISSPCPRPQAQQTPKHRDAFGGLLRGAIKLRRIAREDSQISQERAAALWRHVVFNQDGHFIWTSILVYGGLFVLP